MGFSQSCRPRKHLDRPVDLEPLTDSRIPVSKKTATIAFAGREVSTAVTDELRAIAITDRRSAAKTPNGFHAVIGDDLSVHPLRQHHLRRLRRFSCGYRRTHPSYSFCVCLIVQLGSFRLRSNYFGWAPNPSRLPGRKSRLPYTLPRGVEPPHLSLATVNLSRREEQDRDRIDPTRVIETGTQPRRIQR